MTEKIKEISKKRKKASSNTNDDIDTKLEFKCSIISSMEYLDNIQYPAFIEPKMNGIRAIFFTDTNGYTTSSMAIDNNKISLENTQEISLEINRLGLKNRMIEGVITVNNNIMETKLFTEFKYDADNNDIAYLNQKTQIDEYKKKLSYMIFDITDKYEFKKHDVKKIYSKRREQLEALKIHDSIIKIMPNNKVENKEDALYFATKWIEQGYDGAILKNSNGKYSFEEDGSFVKINRDKETILVKILDVYETARKDFSTKRQANNIFVEYRSSITNRLIYSGVDISLTLDDLTKEKMAKFKHKFIGIPISINGTGFNEHGVLLNPRIDKSCLNLLCKEIICG